MSTDLMLHCGARQVTREELDAIEAPPPTETWYPLKHSIVFDAVGQTLQDAGFDLGPVRLAVSRNDARLFATIDLSTPLAAGVLLAVGIRNSCDKSFPLSFCAGARVFVCDNLAFRSELLVSRKHTRFGRERFQEAIAGAVQALHQFKVTETARLRRMQEAELSEDTAALYMLQAFDKNLVSHLVLRQALAEWHNPSFEEFRPRTLFSLLNAFTTALRHRRDRNPGEYAMQTMRLQHLLSPPQVVEGAPGDLTPADNEYRVPEHDSTVT